MSMANPVERLDPAVQRWIYRQGWPDIREVQKQAIPPILAGDTDLIISASTAAGKTEAAFLPACSAIVGQTQGFGILCISPLKALINDQYRRLESLFAEIQQPLTPWHGDSSQAKKKRAKQNPAGGVLITPESLEAMFMLRASTGWMSAAFGQLNGIIIDEYHAFIGTERGHHLQSLLHRLEHLLGRQNRPIPRIALSATLGDLTQAQAYLRPAKNFPCKAITSTGSHVETKIQQRGYLNPTKINKTTEANQTSSAIYQIAGDLYQHLRGRSNLVFANSRGQTENYAIALRKRSEQQGVPNEFFPHHGSLGKHIRAELETRLQQDTLPTTAVCTMTLEMGIDIGKVASVAQITPAPSVASLRQRLGRSGRRGEPAILRLYIDEDELNKDTGPIEGLRLGNQQSLAMLHLLIGEGWYEPPDMAQHHFSTLIHQILAVIAQWGAVQAGQLWNLLCATGPFNQVTQAQFKALLRHLGKAELITQPASGELILGVQGERLTGHYSFYPAFQAPEEYRLVNAGKTLGTLPAYATTQADQCLVFAGKHWKVKDIDHDKKVINLVRSKGGIPAFSGTGYGRVHDKVRQTMYQRYQAGESGIRLPNGQTISVLDGMAERLYQEGLRTFRELGLQDRSLINMGNTTYLIPWMGDKMVNTLTALIEHGGYTASHRAGVIEVECKPEQRTVADYLQGLDKDQVPDNAALAEAVPEKMKQTEKYDELLPEVLLNAGYGMKQFDVAQALNWLTENKARWAV